MLTNAGDLLFPTTLSVYFTPRCRKRRGSGCGEGLTWEKDEGMMREEAKCLKIKAHFGETRGPISTESVCATSPLALHSRVLDASDWRRLTTGEDAKANPLHILFPHYATRLLMHKAYVGSCEV